MLYRILHVFLPASCSCCCADLARELKRVTPPPNFGMHVGTEGIYGMVDQGLCKYGSPTVLALYASDLVTMCLNCRTT